MEKEGGMHNEKHPKYTKSNMEDDDSHQDSDEDNTSFPRTQKESEEIHKEKKKESGDSQRKKRTLIHRCPFNHRCSHNDVKKRESENFNVNRDFRKESTSVSKSDLEKISNLLQANTGDDNRYLYHVERDKEMEKFRPDKSGTMPVSEYNIRLIQRGLKGVSCQEHSSESYAYCQNQLLPPHLLSSSSTPAISSAQPSCSCPNPCCTSAFSQNLSSFSLPVSSTCPSASSLLLHTAHPKKYRTTSHYLKSPYVRRINETAKAFASLGNREAKDLLQQLPSPVLCPSVTDHSVQEPQGESLQATSFIDSSSEKNLLALADNITSSFRQSCRNFFVEKLCPGATESEVRQVVSAVECLEARVYAYNSSSKRDYCFQLATKFCCIQDELENTSKSSHQGPAVMEGGGGGGLS